MLEPVLTNPWVRAVGVLLAIILLAILAYLLSPVLIPLFFAFIVAYILDPLVDMFEARKISRSVSIAIFAIVGIFLILAIPLFLIPGIVVEADGLVEAAREGYGDSGGISSWFHGMLEKLPIRSLVESLGWAPEDDPEYDPLSVLTVKIAESVREPAVTFMKSHASQMASFGETAGVGIAQIVGNIGRWIVDVFLLLGNVALFAFVAVYLLKDYDDIVAQARELIPPKYRVKTVSIFAKIDSQLKSFLRGQVLVCSCLGLMYMIGLSIAGVPFAILLGAFGAVASFVPYLGIALTIGPAVVLCILQHQGLDWHIIATLATFVVAQMLEGTVLTPKIVGDQVGLGPVWVILAVLVFGSALGFLGLLLAVPIAAILKVLVLEALDYYRQSPLFAEADEEA